MKEYHASISDYHKSWCKGKEIFCSRLHCYWHRLLLPVAHLAPSLFCTFNNCMQAQTLCLCFQRSSGFVSLLSPTTIAMSATCLPDIFWIFLYLHRVMKIIVSIFALLLGFLIIEPVFSTQQKMESLECCSKKSKCNKEKEKQEKNKDCKDQNCNPFMACYLNAPYVTEKIFVFLPGINATTQKIFVTNDNRTFNRLSDFWHPPEFC